ncbi:hypothetical protein OOT00_11590 [Desulfobotulus sp. H1]|uniref:Uncharacterized protein n=1 Tax=Desulfobotulus pelophilus TaxID=2823377 RepID=A0ABT3NAZ2_9BACT|nr:hypothetical protein [Desulfobotulus pelophilus]MCW7754627.1 hypothetical protein [Desulfobotulus pelophilus]
MLARTDRMPTPFLPFYCLILFMLVWPAASPARTAPEAAVPEILQPWIPWVQSQDKHAVCPATSAHTSQALCLWPETLKIDMDNRGARFSAVWEVLFESAVPLPGEAQLMPRNVRVNGRSHAVLLEKNRPVLYLKPGKHTIEGHFFWPRIPDTLALPQEMVLVEVRKNGSIRKDLRRDERGRIWLQAPTSDQKETGQTQTNLRIFRKISDGHPLEMETIIQLAVSGGPRQEKLPIPMPENGNLVLVESPLPLKPGMDEGLIMDLRPGNFTIRLIHLLSGSESRLLLPERQHEELWVFLPRPELRSAELTGGRSIDPRQTALPDAWKQYAAYRISPETDPEIQIRESRQKPAEDKLLLTRNIWLDFDGRGATVQDRLSGTLHNRRYMGMDTHGPLLPSRITLEGQDRLITRQGHMQGIEVPPGPLSMAATSRMDTGFSGNSLPLGWQHPFEKMDTTLHLPPGWHLAAIRGGTIPADASLTSRWSLLDVFFLMLLSGVALRIWGMVWGLGFGLAIGFFHHSFPLPLFFWFGLAATAALGSYAHKHRPARSTGLAILSGIHILLLTAAGLTALPYAADQIRTALYPQLEKLERALPAPSHSRTALQKTALMEEALHARAPEARTMRSAQDVSEVAAIEFAGDKVSPPPPAVTQTGPGTPTWQWRSVPVQTGFISSSHTLDVYLIPPFAASLAALLRVAFVIAVLGRLAAGFPYSLPSPGKNLTATMALLLLLPAAGARSHTEFPPAYLLEELKQRMATSYLCDPNCGRSGAATLRMTAPDSSSPVFSMEMEIHAGRKLAFPIPLVQGTGEPPEIRINAQPASLVFWQGNHHVLLEPGLHSLKIQGSLPPSSIRIRFPMAPDSLQLTAPGWTSEGLDGSGRVQDSLTLIPVLDKKAVSTETARPQIRPFVEVHRTLRRDRYWEVRSEIRRPYAGELSGRLRIPLIPGETVLTDGITVRDGHAEIPIPGPSRRIVWESRLPEEDTVRLSAPKTMDFAERWEVQAHTDRHLAYTGTVAAPVAAGRGLVWTPLPGQILEVTLAAMDPAPGPTLTTEDLFLKLETGKDRQRLTLEAHIRSGKAFLHPMEGPENALLKEIRINGTTQPLPGSREPLLLALTPGSHQIRILWEMPEKQGRRFLPASIRMPSMDMGMPTANIRQEIHLDQNQWLLWTHGPLLGPGVRIWGWVFLVLMLTAIMAVKAEKSPLKTRDWLLLGLGLVSLSPLAILIIGSGFFLFAWRGRQQQPMGPLHNFWQCGLGALLMVMALLLLAAVRNGLLGIPDMQIAGNGSYPELLRWTADRSEGTLPSAGVLIMPLFFWRVLMFAWALWLAGRVLSWAPWAWQALMTGIPWQKKGKKHPEDTGLRLDIENRT